MVQSGEQRKGKGIGMFRRVAKMALKGIRMEAMAAAMTVKGGARKRVAQSNTHIGANVQGRIRVNIPSTCDVGGILSFLESLTLLAEACNDPNIQS